MEQTESLIVEQLKKGNEKAYKFLYEQHYQILCHVAAQYVKDDFLAETIVGDVIFHLWEIRESLEINNNLRSYLLQSVKHRCMDYLKSQYHQKELTALQDFPVLNYIKGDDYPLGRLLEQELAFENKRWLDLIHYNVAEQVMKAYGERVKANPQAYYFPEGYGVAPQSYTNIRILFPLPAAEAALTTYF